MLAAISSLDTVERLSWLWHVPLARMQEMRRVSNEGLGDFMTEDCRQAFEEWAARVNPVSGLEGALKKKPTGEYLWSGTSLAWEAFQAGRASIPAPEVTAIPCTVECDPTPTPFAAKEWLSETVDGTRSFTGKMYWLRDANGNAVAVTGCGPDGERNAHIIQAALGGSHDQQ